MLETYSTQPKLALRFGIVASYNPETDFEKFECTFLINREWVTETFLRSDVVAFQTDDLVQEAQSSISAIYQDYKIVALGKPLSVEALDSQLRTWDPRGYHCGWVSIQDQGCNVGFFNQLIGVVAVLHEDDIFYHKQRVIKVDSGGFILQGVCEDYKFNLIQPAVIGFAPVGCGTISEAKELAEQVRKFHATKHRLLPSFS
ncbi:hypothetical protein L1D14_10540 [Vibrio tubiashii]|uniref:hypothetical protein n=1 Tax=Vibrio tubiashii TaxID=29498 RepID=UPI001EFDECC4|nr:hypothetical protein [Vibrio tubiashii]MCG9576675.1 hypothetical protein [Vibrio tubiashii]